MHLGIAAGALLPALTQTAAGVHAPAGETSDPAGVAGPLGDMALPAGRPQGGDEMSFHLLSCRAPHLVTNRATNGVTFMVR